MGARPNGRPRTSKPRWLRVRAPKGPAYERLRRIVADNRLHTVCESAGCPNIGECWSAGTATFMILGGRCSRGCRFCGVPGGRCDPADADEPRRVAAAVKAMGLEYAVITSVTRDDLPDGGSGLWAETISAVRQACPRAGIEALVPDFQGRGRDQQRVFDARPDVLAHNVETVPRLYPTVRPGARFERSRRLLRAAARAGLNTKSGLMLGLGETMGEVLEVLRRLKAEGVRIVTLGQYLRPSARHLPVARYLTEGEFEELARSARRLGFEAVASGPLVRSSYRAAEHARGLAGRDADDAIARRSAV